MSRSVDPVRPRAYRLLARLYLEGVTETDLPLVRDVPDLAAALPEAWDSDEAAAEHHRLFGREVLPYASIFLESDGALGGDVSSYLERRFRAAGVGVPASGPPDHVGRELELLAVMEEARERGDDGEALAFLDGHVLWWVPSLVPAVRRQADAFWTGVADLTLDLVVDHRALLAGTQPPDHPVPWHLQGVPRSLLDDPTVDLREIATFLMLPARSGLYLSEADARELGRARRLPGGFGSRARVLETVFHSGVAYGGLEELVGDLLTVAAKVRGELEAMVGGGLPEHFAEPWTARLRATERMLNRMARGEGPVA